MHHMWFTSCVGGVDQIYKEQIYWEGVYNYSCKHYSFPTSLVVAVYNILTISLDTIHK